MFVQKNHIHDLFKSKTMRKHFFVANNFPFIYIQVYIYFVSAHSLYEYIDCYSKWCIIFVVFLAGTRDMWQSYHITSEDRLMKCLYFENNLTRKFGFLLIIPLVLYFFLCVCVCVAPSISFIFISSTYLPLYWLMCTLFKWSREFYFISFEFYWHFHSMNFFFSIFIRKQI